MKWHLLFPFTASLLYIASVLFLKRAQQLGGGVLRTTFVANLAVALVFAALLPLGGKGQPAAQLWQPALVAVLFVAGQIFTILALSRGDVSVATPVLGAKTIFVAWFTTLLLATRLPWQLWCAAGLSFAAIALLHQAPRASSTTGAAATDADHHDRRLGQTLLFSLLAAGAYALFDVLVQKWSPVWGLGRFLPIVLGFSAVMSLGFVPFFQAALVGSATGRLDSSGRRRGLHGLAIIRLRLRCGNVWRRHSDECRLQHPRRVERRRRVAHRSLVCEYRGTARRQRVSLAIGQRSVDDIGDRAGGYPVGIRVQDAGRKMSSELEVTRGLRAYMDDSKARCGGGRSCSRLVAVCRPPTCFGTPLRKTPGRRESSGRQRL